MLGVQDLHFFPTICALYVHNLSLRFTGTSVVFETTNRGRSLAVPVPFPCLPYSTTPWYIHRLGSKMTSKLTSSNVPTAQLKSWKPSRPVTGRSCSASVSSCRFQRPASTPFRVKKTSTLILPPAGASVMPRPYVSPLRNGAVKLLPPHRSLTYLWPSSPCTASDPRCQPGMRNVGYGSAVYPIASVVSRAAQSARTLTS